MYSAVPLCPRQRKDKAENKQMNTNGHDGDKIEISNEEKGYDRIMAYLWSVPLFNLPAD